MKPSTFAFLAVVSSSTLALAQPAPAPAPVPPTPPAPAPVAAPAAPPAATPAPAAPTPAAAPAKAAAPAPAAPAPAAPDAAPAPDAEAPASPTDPRAADLSMPVGAWTFRPFGFLRLAYEHVQKDARYAFVGQNSGFVLESARLGMDVSRGELSARLSVDGATADATNINTPQGTLDVNLRDAYARYDMSKYVGVQVGQFYAPFAAEEMRSTTDLLFASRAVGQEGVRLGRGLETPGLTIDRQLGVMLSPKEPIRFGDIGVSAYAMLANGNGANELLNDDSTPAFFGRVEVHFKDWVRAGGAFLRNGRKEGTPPDLLEELDTGFAGDLLVTWNGLEVFGQFAQIGTEFQTAGGSDRTQRAFSAQAGYRIRTPWMFVTPAYRFAELHPWANGDEAVGGVALSSLKVDYHTAGVRLEHLDLPISLFANYTLTMEPEPYELTNNRLQILTQAAF